MKKKKTSVVHFEEKKIDLKIKIVCGSVWMTPLKIICFVLIKWNLEYWVHFQLIRFRTINNILNKICLM
jgi:hypothetical protein